MIPILQALPLDWSAANINNRTKGELHDLSPQFGLPYRIMVLDKGYFYTKNIFLMDSNGRELTEDIDYQCLVFEPTVAKKTGYTACAVIVIINPTVSNYVRVDAQMVGGDYCSLKSAILATAANVIQVANRPVKWENIIDKPSSYHPNGHLHALWELFGFTPQTAIIHRMTTAMNKMAVKEFDNLYGEFIAKFSQISSNVTDTNARLATHIADHQNPHRVNGVQTVTSHITNGSPASLAQAQTASGTVMNAYATPLRVMDSIKTNFLPNLVSHATDYNNPHNDSAALLGVFTNVELQNKGNQYYNRGQTVTYSNALGNFSTRSFYNDVRTDVPLSNITTGVLNWSTYANMAPPNSNYIACPGPNGTVVWRTIQSIIDQYVTKGNQVIYAGIMTTPQPTALIGNVVGNNWPNGTICVVRYSHYYETGNGNGTTYTTVDTLGMATIVNGVWTAPGWG